MVLLSITMTRRADFHWLAHETGRYFPEEWARFRDGVPGGRSRRRSHRRLRPAAQRHATTPAVRIRPSQTGSPGRTRSSRSRRATEVPNPRWADDRFTIGFARLVTHYFSHAAWLEEDELLRNADRLAGHPGRAAPRPPRPVGPAGRRVAAGAGLARMRSSTSSPAATRATPRWTACCSRPWIASAADPELRLRRGERPEDVAERPRRLVDPRAVVRAGLAGAGAVVALDRPHRERRHAVRRTRSRAAPARGRAW